MTSDDHVGYQYVNKFHPRTGHEGPKEEYRYSSTLSLTSALDWGGQSTPRPGRFTPGEDPITTVQEVGWAPGPVWTGAENLAPAGIRSLGRPGRSESLYRLSYPGPYQYVNVYFYLKDPQEIRYLQIYIQLFYSYHRHN